MNVASPGWRSSSPEDLQLLYTIGDLLSIAVERGRALRAEHQARGGRGTRRLAREIHDTLAQGLTATALQLESADALLDAGSEKAHEPLRRALSLTRSNLEEARRSVLDLRASLEGRLEAARPSSSSGSRDGHSRALRGGERQQAAPA